MYVECLGRGVQPIIFLHGWGFNSRVWLNMVPYLEDKYKLYLIDFPGFGKSDFSNRAVESLKKIIPEHSYCVAWSWGGHVAMRLLGRYSKLFQKSIFMNFNPKFIATQHWPGVPEFALQKMIREIKLYNLEKVQKRFYYLCFGKKHKSEIKYFLPDVHSHGQFVASSSLSALQDLLKDDWRDLLGRLDESNCFIFAKEDALIPYELAILWQQYFPNVHAEWVADATHALPITHYELLAHKISRFFGE